MPSSKNLLRHLITVFNATPRSQAISALFIPSAAASTILARSTMRAWAVPLRVKTSRRHRSSSLNSITNGLRRDNNPPDRPATRTLPPHTQNNTHVVPRSTTKWPVGLRGWSEPWFGDALGSVLTSTHVRLT